MRVLIASCLLLAALAVAQAQLDSACINDPATDFTASPTVDVAEIDGSNYRIQITFPTKYDAGVTVEFGGSGVNAACQLGSAPSFYEIDDPNSQSGVGHYDIAAATGVSDPTKPCTKTVEFETSTANMLGTCGFTQDTRDANAIHFVNTVTITVRRNAEKTAPGNANRKITTVQTSTFEFAIDIEVPTNTSGTSSSASVFGEVQPIFVIQSITIDNSINNNYPGTFSGEVIFRSSVQAPYSLLKNGDGITYTSQDSSTNNHELDTPNPARCTTDSECLQTWNFTFDLPSACTGGVTTQSLNMPDVQFDFLTECNSAFTGACAPTFTKIVAYTVTFTSPNFCPREATASLSASVSLYKAGSQSGITTTDLANDFARFAPTSQSGSGVTANGAVDTTSFSTESVFTYESFLFGEVAVTVAGDAATIIGTKIYQIEALRPDNGAAPTLVLFNSCPSDVCTDIAFDGSLSNGIPAGTLQSDQGSIGANVLVDDQWFDSNGESAYDNTRARFAVKQVDVTLPRTSAELTQDAAITVQYRVSAIVRFSEGASIPLNPILASFAQNRNAKERMVVSDFGANAGGASASVTSVVIVPATNTPPAASGSSSALSGNVLIIGGIAVGAAVLGIGLTIAIMRRRNNKAAAAAALPATILGSSSSTQLVAIQNCYSAAQDEALNTRKNIDEEAQTPTSA